MQYEGIMGSIFDLILAAGVLLLIAWAVWAAVKKFWPTAASSSAGTVVGQVIDTTQAWSAYAALKAVRELDSVEADPKAIAACDYLLPLVLNWKRPETAETKIDTTPAANKTGDVETVTFK